MKEIITKQLSCINPEIPDSLVEFNYGTGEFILLPPPGNMVIVYESQGTLLHKDSEEAQLQMIEMGIDRK